MSVFSGHSQTFSYTGAVQQVTLNPGSYEIEMWGANGGGGFHTSLISNEGKGGYSKGTLTVTTPTTYYIYVGGKGQDAAAVNVGDIHYGGWNGGGDSGQNNYTTLNQYRAGGGGGGTDIRTTQNTTYANRLMVAGGGGGGVYLNTYPGGHAGGLIGEDGGNTNHGKGGTQTAGGVAVGTSGNIVGTDGALGLGGAGGSASGKSAGAGGGGGYYGGGGGATGNSTTSQGGGGGGSAYLGGVATGVTFMFGETGYIPNPDLAGNGYVSITSMVPCAGTPNSGVAAATPRMCASEPFTLTATGATKAGGITYQWQRADAGTGVWVDVPNATSANFTVTNQSVASDYRFVVTCTTSNSTSTSNIVNVNHPVASSFNENFDAVATGGSANNTIPTCWSYLDSHSGYGYTTTTAAQTGKGFYVYVPVATGNLMLISPETDNLGNGLKQIRFSAKVSSTSYIPYQNLEIYTMNGTTGTATKTIVPVSFPLTTTWQEFIVPLPATTDDYFAFSFNSQIGASYIYIDDVYYEDLSSCAAPGNIGAINITATGATVNWNKSLATGVTGYDWEVRDMNGLVVKSGTISNANTVSAAVTGLTPGTYYQVFVRSKCGTTPGVWTTNPHKFATLCAVITGNFFEGFENTSPGSSTTVSGSNIASQPLCWSYIDTNSGYAYTSTTAAQGPSTQGFYVYRTTATGDLLLVSPETSNLGSGNKRIRFSAKVSSTTYIPYQKMEIVTMNGNTATATKTVVAANLPLTTNWEEFIVYLPNTTDDYFAFSFKTVTGASYIYIDDIYYEDVPPVVIDVTKTDVLCNGAATGTLEVEVEGGKPPYTYSWSPTGATTAVVTNVPAGTHTVTVTDDRGTIKTASVTITEPTLILPNFNSVNVSCNGKNNGSASVAPSGGIAPYTVLWSDGKIGLTNNNLAPGSYSVTVRDANSCPVTHNFTIVEPLALVTSVGTQTNVSVYGGNDGSATVTATGGTAPYTYLWSPVGGTSDTASNLSAGTYNVLVTDSKGCSTTQTVVITQPAIPYDIVLVSQQNITCNGANDGSISVNVTGGLAPYTYVWSNAAGNTPTISNLSVGTYDLTVTDADSNVITASYTITEPSVLSTTSSITDVTCNGLSNGTATVLVSGGTAPYSYFWSNGMTTATANNLTAATYSVTVTDANNCKSTTSVTIAQPGVLTVTPTVTDISCFGQLDGSITLNITGGAAPFSYVWSSGQTTANISGLAAGVYTVTVTDANNCTATQTATVVAPGFVYAPVATNQSFCTGQNATLADVVVTGSNIKWYNAATGGALLPATTVLVNGVTYYASQTVGLCESSSRTAVQITLGQGAPLTTTQLNVCSNTRVQNMVVDGLNYTQLRWYTSATSTTPMVSSQLLATGVYYVSSYVGSCESAKQAISVTVASVVAAPTASSQTVCGNSTLDDLVVSKDPSATLRWYSSAQTMTTLPNNTVVSTGTYYVQQVLGNCESVRVPVSVQVINVSAPAMTSIATCEGNTIADLHPSVGKYVWYTSTASTTALAESFVITPGTYYISLENTGCESTRTSVIVTVSPRPTSPTGQLTQMFAFSAKVSNLVMNQPNVSWFATYNDAVRQQNQLSVNHFLQNGATYYGILTGTNNCGSFPTAVTVTLNLSDATLDLAQLNYYPNPVADELNISYNEEITKVEVFSITGQKILSQVFKSNEVKVDMGRMSSGTYLVKIETANASQFVKVIKK